MNTIELNDTIGQVRDANIHPRVRCADLSTGFSIGDLQLITELATQAFNDSQKLRYVIEGEFGYIEVIPGVRLEARTGSLALRDGSVQEFTTVVETVERADGKVDTVVHVPFPVPMSGGTVQL
jgi:hypothetical protein